MERVLWEEIIQINAPVCVLTFTDRTACYTLQYDRLLAMTQDMGLHNCGVVSFITLLKPVCKAPSPLLAVSQVKHNQLL